MEIIDGEFDKDESFYLIIVWGICWFGFVFGFGFFFGLLFWVLIFVIIIKEVIIYYKYMKC